jgi:hypothetical protein
MPLSDTQPAPDRQVKVDLVPYTADVQLTTLTPGIDNLHHDVALSPRFLEFSRRYIADLIRQAGNLARFYGNDAPLLRTPETAAFRKMLGDLLQAGLNRAHFERNIELDILLRLAILRFLAREITGQFAGVVQECNEYIRRRGELFERSERAQVMKATLAEFQADRRNIFRLAGQQVCQVIFDLEEANLAKARRAVFGDEFRETYELLANRLLFVEGGKDDQLFLEHYVLLGNFMRDADRYEVFESLLLEFLRDFVLAGPIGEEVRLAWQRFDEVARQSIEAHADVERLQAERETLDRKLHANDSLLTRFLGSEDPNSLRAARTKVDHRLAALRSDIEALGGQIEEAKQKVDFLSEFYQTRLADFLNQPENARRLFDPQWGGAENLPGAQSRDWLRDRWVKRLEQRELLPHIVASYEVRNIHTHFCPPLHLQQLKKALVMREELKRVEDILRQFPARRYSISKIEELAKSVRRYSREQARTVALKFAEDYMRLRRDVRNLQRLNAILDKLSLIENDRTREISHLNNSLYEYMLPDESRSSVERVTAHVIIKADVRNSTSITHDLMSRGMNPASHFSLNLYEPVKRLLERYGAAKVFIEGDAIILAIYETESTRAHQRAVAKACALAREIVQVSELYNSKQEGSPLPRLELGLGVAFQNSAPTLWMDGESRIMISRAINLSDRLSSCSKLARRTVQAESSPFRVFLFQTMLEGTAEEEAEELMIRFNMSGILLNDEGFAKLSEEIALTEVEANLPLPWGHEPVKLYFGEVPVGTGLEKIVLRKGFVHNLMPGGVIGKAGTTPYYEVCSSSKIVDLAEALARASTVKNPA